MARRSIQWVTVVTWPHHVKGHQVPAQRNDQGRIDVKISTESEAPSDQLPVQKQPRTKLWKISKKIKIDENQKFIFLTFAKVFHETQLLFSSRNFSQIVKNAEIKRKDWWAIVTYDMQAVKQTKILVCRKQWLGCKTTVYDKLVGNCLCSKER